MHRYRSHQGIVHADRGIYVLDMRRIVPNILATHRMREPGPQKAWKEKTGTTRDWNSKSPEQQETGTTKREETHNECNR